MEMYKDEEMAAKIVKFVSNESEKKAQIYMDAFKNHQSMHIPRIAKQSSEEVIDRWTDHRSTNTICPEYVHAYNKMIISPYFMGHTSSQSFLKRLQDEIKKHPLKRTWTEQLSISIAKAWNCTGTQVKGIQSNISEIECGNVWYVCSTTSTCAALSTPTQKITFK
jgi:hypothetical protein